MANCIRGGVRYKRHRFRTHRGSPDAGVKVCEACGAQPIPAVFKAAAAERQNRRRLARLRHRGEIGLAMPIEQFVERYMVPAFMPHD